MDAIEQLLAMDKGKFKPQTRKVKIERLSTEETPFYVELTGLTADEVAEMQDMMIKFVDGKATVDTLESELATVNKGVTNINFNDEKLKKHLGVRTPYDAIKTIFNKGEISGISNHINDISGYKGDAVTEVKN